MDDHRTRDATDHDEPPTGPGRIDDLRQALRSSISRLRHLCENWQLNVPGSHEIETEQEIPIALATARAYYRRLLEATIEEHQDVIRCGGGQIETRRLGQTLDQYDEWMQSVGLARP